MDRRIKNLMDVVEWNMCIGCGACYSYCEKDAIELINIQERGIIPKIDRLSCGDCDKCLDFCPGARVKGHEGENTDKFIGKTMAIWEGSASDESVRFAGSSGGMVTALASFCLSELEYDFVVHTGMNKEQPWQNETKISRSLSDLMKGSGSRYNVSSPCEALKLIEKAKKPCVFIGKPCDVAAVAEYRKLNKSVDEKLGLVLSFFCAGTPTVGATQKLINKLGFDYESINFLKYRGEGWPGHFHIISQDGAEKKITYDESWGFLSGIRPFRCNLCPDGMAESSDITCGDAWHKFSPEDNGLSLVLVRTERGKAILDQAVKKGFVNLVESDKEAVYKAQPGLYGKRKDIWGRLKAMDMVGVPHTKFEGFSLGLLWKENNFFHRVKKILGTIRRLFTKGLTKRRSFH